MVSGGKRQQLHLRSVFGSHKHNSSKESIPPILDEPKKEGKRENQKDAPAVGAAVSRDSTETAAEDSVCSSVLSGVDYYPDDYSVSSSYHSPGTSVGPTTSRTNNFCGEVHKHINSKECIPSAFVVPKPEGKQEKQKGTLVVSAAVSKDCTEKTVGCSDGSVLSSFDYYPDDYSICSSYHSQGTNVVPTTTGTSNGDFTRVFRDSCDLGPNSDISDDDDDDDYSYDWSYSVGFRDTDVPS